MRILYPAIVVDTNIFASGDSIGGKVTLTGALSVTNGTIVVDQIDMIDRDNQKPVGEWFFFESNPSVATITNNVAFVFSTDDLKLIGRVPVASGDWTSTNSKGIACIRNIGLYLKGANANKDLYAAFVTTSTPTFTTTAAFMAKFHVRDGSFKN